MNILTDILIILLVSIILTGIFAFLRKFIPQYDKDTVDTINYIFTFVALFVSLILTFTISNLLTRYNTLSDNIIDDVERLSVITRFLQQIEGSDEILNDIRDFSTYVLQENRDLDVLFTKYSKINKNIVRFIKTNNTPFNSEILSRFKVNQVVSRELLTNLNGNNYLFYITLFFTIIALVLLLFIQIGNYKLQWLLDFSIFTIIIASLYVIYIYSYPFKNTSVKISFKPFNKLITILNDV